jgi:hypothetical protein
MTSGGQDPERPGPRTRRRDPNDRSVAVHDRGAGGRLDTGHDRRLLGAAREDDNGDVIRRADGLGAGQPRWRVGDDVLIYHPASGRFIAHQRVAIEAEWNETEATWDFELEVVAFDRNGPTAESLGGRDHAGRAQEAHLRAVPPRARRLNYASR